MVTSEATSLPLAESTALAELEAMVTAATDQGAAVRGLGGVAVAMRCASARKPAPFARMYSDLDVVTDKKSSRTLTRILTERSYEPERRFNALHGHRRMHFDRPADGIHLDVFVDEFVMCHRLELTPRLAIHEQTVPLADLLLTKLQVAELNAKDVTDAAALLFDHELTPDEAGINTVYVTALLSRDWGWWRTVSHNLLAIPGHLGDSIPPDARRTVSDRVEQLVGLIDRAPKSMRWRARARAGERMPWYDEPE
jgi:hypothetical protein